MCSINDRASISLGSNFPNGDFDELTHFEVPLIRQSRFYRLSCVTAIRTTSKQIIAEISNFVFYMYADAT